MWRRKFLILSSALLFLISVWAWAIFYTAYTNNKGTIKEITIQVSQKNNTFQLNEVHVSHLLT